VTCGASDNEANQETQNDCQPNPSPEEHSVPFYVPTAQSVLRLIPSRVVTEEMSPKRKSAGKKAAATRKRRAAARKAAERANAEQQAAKAATTRAQKKQPAAVPQPARPRKPRQPRRSHRQRRDHLSPRAPKCNQFFETAAHTGSLLQGRPLQGGEPFIPAMIPYKPPPHRTAQRSTESSLTLKPSLTPNPSTTNRTTKHFS
jgi:hypothetical protein